MPDQRKTVLVVEDEFLLRDLVEVTLSEHGFLALAAETGDQAISMMGAIRNLDALFTDIRLPGDADGWDVAEQARLAHPKIAVIYATGYVGEGAMRMVSGATLLRKPYSVEQMAQKLVALLGCNS